MAWIRSHKKGSGGGSGLPILSGITDPTSSQGTNGQEYVKYANYIYKSFYDGAIIIRENTDDSTDIKAFINGFTKSSNDYIEITDANLLAYLSDITAGKFKACDIYKQNDSTQYAFFFMNQNGTMYINTTNSSVSSRVTGTFYDGMIDLNQPAVSSATAYQKNGHQTIGGTASKRVNNAFLRKNDTWQDLIGSDIDDMILSVGGSPVQRITYKNYAKFDSEGIILPFACNTDYTITAEFYDTKTTTANALFSATGSNTVSTLVFYMSNASNYAVGTGKGSGGNVTMTRSVGNHTVIMNDSNSQTVLDGTQSTSFTRNNLSSRKYTVGCQVDSITNVFQEYFKSYKLESLSTGNKICELKPVLLYEEFPCLYDSVNDKVYMPYGLTVMDTLPS